MNGKRPCIEFHAELERLHTGGWAAKFGDGFWATGRTPAEAMDNFDAIWLGLDKGLRLVEDTA